VDEDAVTAAVRVLNAYQLGVPPESRDLWTIQLSVVPLDAADLLLSHEDLARKIVTRHRSASGPAHFSVTA
jgi:hypothetical protein